MVIVILVVSTCFLYLVRSWFSNMSFNTNNNSKIVFSEFYVCIINIMAHNASWNAWNDASWNAWGPKGAGVDYSGAPMGLASDEILH